MKKKEVLELLEYWLQPKEDILNDLQEHRIGFVKMVSATHIEDQRRVFIDRNSDILLMAHIDTVQTPQLKKSKGNKIWAAGLDDRLGCMLAWELSKELNTDLLITDHEESAASTGQFHELKDYNWIAEFDRNGGDVVTYDLENDEFVANLRKYFEVGMGTVSDLCFLETNACCVNIGIGYKHDHSVDSYVDLNVMNSQIDKFKRFYQACNLMKFVQDPERQKNTRWYRSDWQDWERDYYDEKYGKDSWDERYVECYFCGNYDAREVWGTNICQNCFESMTSMYLYSEWEEYQKRG